MHVGAGLLAQVGDLVDEGDLGGEKSVGGIFGQFRRPPPHEDQRRLIEIERTIDFGENIAGFGIVGTDDDAIRPLEIRNGRALAQEFRIGDHGEFGVRTSFADDPLDLIAGAHRYGGFVDDDGEAFQGVGNLGRRCVDIGEVRMAIAAPRRSTDGDEDRIGFRNRRRKIGGERQALLADVAGNERRQARLENRYFAPLERGNTVGTLVDADNRVAKIRETGARNQPDIAGPNHRNTHAFSVVVVRAAL